MSVENQTRSVQADHSMDPSESSRSLRSFVFCLAAIGVGTACVLGALRYFASDRLPELTEDALAKAMDQWAEQGPSDYMMDVVLQGARPGTVHVEVRKGEVVAHTRDGRVPNESTWYTWSVPGMFDMLLRDLQIAADPQHEIGAAAGAQWRLSCRFDSRFGYPANYRQIATGGGPNVFWEVTLFEPQTQ